MYRKRGATVQTPTRQGYDEEKKKAIACKRFSPLISFIFCAI
jgi:hypothetical protein